jgi:5-methylcytosine-specific restriction endonuclease McrA
MSTPVLLLNADYQPLKVIPWERAVSLLLDEKVRVVEEYAGRAIRSASATMAFPAVVALVKYAEAPTKVRFNRSNVLARDGYACQYCGSAPLTASGNPRLEDLTLDHVVPRAQSRDGFVRLPWNGKRVPITCWENVVCACIPCNAAKADRTPAEARMVLRVWPRRPNVWDSVRMTLTRTRIPEEWKLYIPENVSGWRGYWDDELDSD